MRTVSLNPCCSLLTLGKEFIYVPGKPGDISSARKRELRSPEEVRWSIVPDVTETFGFPEHVT